MNKLLPLLYFTLLFSSSFCEDCTTESCGEFNIEGKEQANYVCAKTSSDPEACGWVPLCDYAEKPAEAATTFCSSQQVTDNSKFACVDTSDQTKCEEVSICESIKKIEGGTPETYGCSEKAVSDSDKYACVDDTSDSANACLEIEYCPKEIAVTENSECSKLPIKGQGTEITKVCVKIEDKCKEEFYCSKVPMPANNENSVVCSNYILSEANKDTHLCIQNLESDTYACKEEFLCTQGQGETDQECNKYPVTIENKDKNICVLDSKPEKKCKEIELCEKAVLTGEITDEICNNYPVKTSNSGTHTCVKNSDATACIEQPLSCEEVQKIGDKEIKCSDYQVTETNKETHKCVPNPNGDKPCKEEQLCQSHTEETSDENCRKYPVTEVGKKACILNPTKDTNGCIEKELCNTVTVEEGVDCSAYPVSDDKIKTHICKAVTGEATCSQVEIECSTAEKGESDEQCGNYKVSDAKYKCVKNTDTTEGAKPCIEKEKETEPSPEPEITACADKTTGATDDICSKLSVAKKDEQKCIKNPKGENCMLLYYCQYGIGTTDEECSAFALKDENKACKKKANENLCEEVVKNTSEDTTKDSKDTTKDSTDTNKDSTDTTKDSKDTTKDSTDNTKGSDDTTKGNDDNTADDEGSSDGNFLNVAYALLLLISLL